MKSLLLFVALSTLAYGQPMVVLERSQGGQQDIPIVVNEGNNVTFRCDISGTITVSVRPPGSVFVTNLPANVMTDGRDDSVTITVVNAQRDENTLAFQCGAVGQSTNNGILTVYYAPNYTNPGPRTFREGDTNAQVTVSLDANPSPDFMWTRGGMPISDNNIVQTVNTITFNRARREDTGTYTIFGNNTAGSDSATFDITVNYSPQFESRIGNVQCSGSEPTYTCAVMTGSGGVLNCSAIGSPNPTVAASRDPNIGSTVEFMDDQFTITGADAETAGNYSCNASNSVGSDVRTFQVWVGGAPTLVRFDSFNVSDPNVVITWTFNDNGVPVISFNLTINCDGQLFWYDDVPVFTMGNQVTFTWPLETYPADTRCTVTAGASNLLGSSNDLIIAFMTPATGTGTTIMSETTSTPGGAGTGTTIMSETTSTPGGAGTSTSAAVIGGAVAAVLAVLVITVIVCVVVFVAIRRRRHTDKSNVLSGKEAVKWSEVNKGENEGITASEEDTGEYEVDFEECDAYGIVPEADAEYEISTKKCSAYGI